MRKLAIERGINASEDRALLRIKKRLGQTSTISRSDNAWSVTFTDLLTLLVGFFVLRLSMATELQTSELFVQNTQAHALEQAAAGVALRDELRLLLQATALSDPQAEGRGLVYAQGIAISPIPDGVQISFEGGTFASGSDELSPAALVAAKTISQLAKANSYRIRIEGHTDSRPIFDSRFPSNWELSAARAIALAKSFIQEGCLGERISVAGYADTKQLPLLAGVTTAAGEEAQRRVEVLVTKK